MEFEICLVFVVWNLIVIVCYNYGVVFFVKMLNIYLAQFIKIFVSIFDFLLIVRVLASWMPQARNNRLIHIVFEATDPAINFVKKFVPPIGMFDISPIVVFFGLDLLSGILLQLLRVA